MTALSDMKATLITELRETLKLLEGETLPANWNYWLGYLKATLHALGRTCEAVAEEAQK